MKAHELAKLLLEGPNLPVVINGWGSEGGFTFEVTRTEIDATTFLGEAGHKDPRCNIGRLGYPPAEECVCLEHG